MQKPPPAVAFAFGGMQGQIALPQFDQRALLVQDADAPRRGGGPETHAFQDGDITLRRYRHNLLVSTKLAV